MVPVKAWVLMISYDFSLKNKLVIDPSKDLNGDWVSKSGTDKAIVLCQTRDYWRHFILKRCIFTDGTNEQLPLVRPGSADGTRPENHP